MNIINNFKLSGSMLITFLVLSMTVAVFAQKRPIQEIHKVDKSQLQTVGPLQVLTSVKNDLSLPLRELVRIYIPPIRTSQQKVFPLRPYPFESLVNEMPFVLDPSLQDWQGSGGSRTVLLSFDGVEDGDNTGFAVAPSDQNGDVGPNHYVQMANSISEIFNKAGTTLLGPFDNNALWAGFGGPCQNDNNGDPVVLYDQLADRWFLSQFAVDDVNNQSICVACSQTSDPTGAYYRYQFNFTTDFPDYPKFGVWGDAYTATYRVFPNAGGFDERAGALERDAMLAGNPAQMVVFSISNLITDAGADGFLPADLDGAAPSAGAPIPILGQQDDGLTGAPNDRLALFELTPDWNNTANSTFTGPTFLITDPYDARFTLGIPQPGTAQRLDILPHFTMFSLQTRDFGTHMSMVANHTVDVGTNHAGIRWYELRNSGGGWSIFQQGTYAPDNDNRWMGSIAMDGNGNIALGYSVSSSSTYPSLRFTGHTAGAAAGVMDAAEETIHAGTGSQNSPDRWGDYSMMTVDPTDDATFWYTNQYYATTSSFNWKTRIGSFTLAPPPEIDVLPTSFTFNVQENGTDSDILTISNVADPSANLNWTMTDQTAAVKLMVNSDPDQLAGTRQGSEGISGRSYSVEAEVINGPFKLAGPSIPSLQNTISMVLDDGSVNTIFGFGGYEQLWLNRFTPSVNEFPFNLTEVQIAFYGNVGEPTPVQAGDLIDVYIYADGDSDPSNGATHIGSLNSVAIQVVGGFSVFSVSPAIRIDGPGDVLIAVVTQQNGGYASNPSALDATTTAQRSWVGYGSGGGAIPDPPSLPVSGFDLVDNYGNPGNWMIRGYGESATPDWLSENPTAGSIGSGNNENVTISVDATGLALGTYQRELVISTNDPNNPTVTVPVTLNVVDPATLGVKAFMEGPFDSDSMRTNISASLPLSQPYSGSPWNYGGTESVSAIPADVVDWVLVELRSSTDASSKADEHAAFIKSDGSVVDLDGTNPVTFVVASGNYYICIHHRNHLSIMSAAAQTVNSSSTSYNFTTSLSQFYGNDAKQLASGIFGMYSGDGQSDGDVDASDINLVWRPQNGTGWSYSKFGDYDMDGDIDASDINLIWRPNNGKGTHVP